MSYPPTEYAEISNDSLFSDSVDFDRAEKPPSALENHNNVEDEEAAARQGKEEEAAAVHERTVEGLEYSASTDPRSRTGSLWPEESNDVAPPPAPAAAYLKPRRLPTSQPLRWQPVALAVPPGDEADEFDITSAQQPIYAKDEDDEEEAEKESAADARQKRTSKANGAGAQKTHKAAKIRFTNGEPDMHGDVSNCFEEPGLLYRIVDKRNRTWAFYNDSLVFEIHITCTFGKHSKIEALDNTILTRNAEGEYVAEVTVYPTETERFVKGFVNGFSSKLRALPLSDDYYTQRSHVQAEQTIANEIAAIKAAAAEGNPSLLQSAESILQLCLEHDLPFVDLTFPPTQASLERGAGRPFKPLPWARPHMFLPPELRDQIRLFRHPILPGAVDQGELGDCWLTCAIATIAESPAAIMNLFRHPRGAEAGRRERALGAYRVTLNHGGLWRSVVVDDYLPVIAQSPKFARGLNDPCELWPAILQKAYAKLCGSYAMIQAGDPIHALTDLTGCPSMRFDEAWLQATAPNASRSGAGVAARTALFDRWAQWCGAGHRVIVTTPGKAPAILPGRHNQLDFSEEPEMAQRLSGTGLLPGHAYTVLAARQFTKEKLQLVKCRRAWRPANVAPWAGDWSPSSPLWTQNPAIANAVKFDPHDETVMWMPYETLLSYGNGGGVCFTAGPTPNNNNATITTKNSSDVRRKSSSAAGFSASTTLLSSAGGASRGAWDYRLPLTFASCKSSVVCALRVAAPTTLTLSLSNYDPRFALAQNTNTNANTNNNNNNVNGEKKNGALSNHADGMAYPTEGEENNNTMMNGMASGVDYPPIMLSVCAPSAEEKDTYSVLLNTAADVTEPSSAKWTFLQAREIAMTCTLQPQPEPYLIIPRLMEMDTTVELPNSNNNSNKKQLSLRESADAEYFANDYRHVFPNSPLAKTAMELPVTLGLRVMEPLTKAPGSANGEASSNNTAGNANGHRASTGSAAGMASVHLMKLDPANCVFENFPKFPSDDVSEVPPLYYQVKEPGCGFAQERHGIDLL